MRMKPLLLLSALFLLSAACAGAADIAPAAESSAMKELRDWWSAYQSAFIQADGRLSRPLTGGDTVSEGQAYAMLFAALLDDRPAFEKVHRWTNENLSRTIIQADNLLACHWRNGKVADWNSASDADLDYALALILGHERWGNKEWLAEARLVAADVLKNETKRADDMLFMTPGIWGGFRDEGIGLNPSHFSPATYRYISNISDAPEWNELIEDTYSAWTSMSRYLGKRKGVGLIPDWCRYTPKGEYRSINVKAPTYGWEALRYPMRAGMDALIWNCESARELMRDGPCSHFTDWFAKGHDHAVAVYDYDGRLWDGNRSLAMSAMALFAYQAAGETPPEKLVTTFDEQRNDPFFNRDHLDLSMTFFPLACRAGILTRERK